MSNAVPSWFEIAGAPRPVDVTPESAPPDALEDVFGLIERTAETIRSLRNSSELVEASEQACRLQLERDRGIWRDDLEEMKRTVESCIERAIAAEEQAEEAKSQTRLAVQLCNDTRTLEKAAIERAQNAEARARLAEDRLARLQEALSLEFSHLLAGGSSR